MNTTLTTQITLADAVYNIAKIVREVDDTITHVKVETSDQGQYLTVGGVRWGELHGDTWLEEALGTDPAVEVEDWATQLSWDDANDEAKGWHTVNSRGGYYEIDVDEALKAEAPVEIKAVDLVQGVLALHALHVGSDDQCFPYECSCGVKAASLIDGRRHVAEQIVEVLS